MDLTFCTNYFACHLVVFIHFSSFNFNKFSLFLHSFTISSHFPSHSMPQLSFQLQNSPSLTTHFTSDMFLPPSAPLWSANWFASACPGPSWMPSAALAPITYWVLSLAPQHSLGGSHLGPSLCIHRPCPSCAWLQRGRQAIARPLSDLTNPLATPLGLHVNLPAPPRSLETPVAIQKSVLDNSDAIQVPVQHCTQCHGTLPIPSAHLPNLQLTGHSIHHPDCPPLPHIHFVIVSIHIPINFAAHS